MKIADVKIGETYLTRVSGALVKVVAIARIEPDGRWNKQARFRVCRTDNGKTLDKARTASALRPASAPDLIAERLLADLKMAQLHEDGGQWADAVAVWERIKTTATENNRPRAAKHADRRLTIVRAEIAKAREMTALEAMELVERDAANEYTTSDTAADPEAAK